MATQTSELSRVIAASGSYRGAAAQNMPLILAACNRYGVTDRAQIAYILATAEHESELQPIEEGWGPTSDQRKYEGSSDLGNTQPGDGFRYRGRGFVQITGRDRYSAWSQELGVDLVADPNKALDPTIAARILVQGMKEGGFRSIAPGIVRGGYRLGEFIHEDSRIDFYGARKIVNYPDAAQTADVARRASRYYEVLKTVDRDKLRAEVGGQHPLTSPKTEPQDQPVLRLGSRGEAVLQLQQQLQQQGYSVGPNGADGIFGPATKVAVIQLQDAQNLRPTDGIVGPQTWQALEVPTTRQPTSLPKTSTARVLEVPWFSQGVSAEDDIVDAAHEKGSYAVSGQRLYKIVDNQRIPVPYQNTTTKAIRGPQSCLSAAQAMAGAVGTIINADESQDIQVMASNGVTDARKSRQALSYIDSQLEMGRVVVVGAHYQPGSPNADSVTDHYIVITGIGRDENGRTFYTYNDSATRAKSQSQGRLSVDSTGRLTNPQGFLGAYQVSQVLGNDEQRCRSVKPIATRPIGTTGGMMFANAAEALLDPIKPATNGTRTYQGSTYTIQEQGNSLSISAQGRGEILKIDNGRLVVNSVTSTDIVILNQVAHQTHFGRLAQGKPAYTNSGMNADLKAMSTANAAQAILEHRAKVTQSGSRTFNGNTYDIMQQGQTLTIAARGRGEILKIQAGKVVVNRVTDTDVVSLNKVAHQLNQIQPPTTSQTQVARSPVLTSLDQLQEATLALQTRLSEPEQTLQSSPRMSESQPKQQSSLERD